MSEAASAPPYPTQPIGFIAQQPQAESNGHPPPPYSTPYNLPYPPQSHSVPYPPAPPPTHYPPFNSVHPSDGGGGVQTTQPSSNNTIVIQQPPELGPDPIACHCPVCGEFITTKVTYKSGTRTHMSAALLCAMDQDCCALIPYCCNCTKDAHHYCPKCEHYFGKHEPLL